MKNKVILYTNYQFNYQYLNYIYLDKMKPQSIAKLCAQTEEYYAEAAKLMDREPIMMSLDKEWTSNVSISIEYLI